MGIRAMSDDELSAYHERTRRELRHATGWRLVSARDAARKVAREQRRRADARELAHVQ